MSEPDGTSDNSGWPTWKCALFTGGLCAIPLLLPILASPVAGLSMLAILILLFLGSVKMYGPGFVVEGGCGVLTLSVIFFLVTPWFYTWLYDPPTGRVEDPPWDLLLILAAVGVGVVGVSVVAVYCHLQDRRLRRLYEEADIRLIGGPFDGHTLDQGFGGNEWPPDPELVIYSRIENHAVRHIYERTEEGAYHFSRTLAEVQ